MTEMIWARQKGRFSFISRHLNWEEEFQSLGALTVHASIYKSIDQEPVEDEEDVE